VSVVATGMVDSALSTYTASAPTLLMHLWHDNPLPAFLGPAYDGLSCARVARRGGRQHGLHPVRTSSPGIKFRPNPLIMTYSRFPFTLGVLCPSLYRLGSAGTVREDVAVGSIAVASLGAAEIVQNCTAYHQPPGAVRTEPYYRTSGVVLPDDQLCQMVR